MDLRYLDDNEWCDLVPFQLRPSLDDFVNMFAEEEMVGTSRVTDVEGWVLLERNFCLTSLFQNWVILLWHTPKKRRYLSWFISFWERFRRHMCGIQREKSNCVWYIPFHSCCAMATFSCQFRGLTLQKINISIPTRMRAEWEGATCVMSKPRLKTTPGDGSF